MSNAILRISSPRRGEVRTGPTTSGVAAEGPEERVA